MSMVATDIKGLLTINIKPRHDTITDQYNRIFMVKMLMISSLIMGISWFSDSIQCIVPDSHGIDGGFVAATCWIQGLYVYKELQSRIDLVAYYGIPKNMDHNGMIKGTQDLCTTDPKLGVRRNPNCLGMTKTFFLQYQYMPFLIAALGILYYVPYVMYVASNQDIISLRKDVKGDNVDAKRLVKHYFNNKEKSSKKLAWRVLVNIVIKLLYFAVNLITLLVLNRILNDEFVGYGSNWSRWTTLDNHIAHDYMGLRDFPKPGNNLLPPFAYCEMYESARDIKTTVLNKHKFVCELSQNILYQYVLLVLWFCIIFGLVVSAVGLLSLLLNHLITKMGTRRDDLPNQKPLNSLSFREIEYLEYIRKRDISLYDEVLQQVRDNLINMNAKAPDYPYAMHERSNLYPSLPRKGEEGC